MSKHIRIEPGGSLHISGDKPVSILNVRRNGQSVVLTISSPGATILVRQPDGSLSREIVDSRPMDGIHLGEPP